MILGVIFELIFEVLFEIVGELIIEVLGDAVFQPLWRRYGTERRKRLLVGALVGLTAVGYGFAWGAYRASAGALTLPQSVWVALVLAAAFALAAVLQPRLPGWGPSTPGRFDLRTGLPQPAPVGSTGRTAAFRNAVLPWCWTRRRLANFAAANLAIAAGITSGYLIWS